MNKKIQGAMWFIIVILCIFMMVRTANDALAENQCDYYKHNFKVILDKSPIFDRCLIVENGTEYTMAEFITKHKYDGIEVRK